MTKKDSNKGRVVQETFQNSSDECSGSNLKWGSLMGVALPATLISISTLTVLCQVPTAVASEQNIEEVQVLGTRIKRKSQSATSTPLENFDQKSLSDNGVKDIRDLVELMPMNSGAQNNSDNLTQNYTAGTNNINLRGLGVSSTLVLLNGRRQVLSAVQTDNGASFVDTASLIPTLAIDTVEILKDGASAIYGSDAVAGVVNFKTRDDFEGAEIQVEHRHRTSNGSQDDTNVDFVVGGNFQDTGHFLLAASHLKRTSLVAQEVDWLIPTDGTSGYGNPGSFIVPSTGLSVADPDCEQNGGFLNTTSTGGTLCLFDFGPQVTFVPEEQRLQGFARANWQWSDTTSYWSEIGYSRNKISREVSPSFPVLNTPVLPVDNPANTFGEDVFFLGRPYGNGQPTEKNFYDHSTFRFGIGIAGQISESIDWELSYVTAQNDAILNPRDVIADNFQAALNGLGGVNCAGTTPNVNGCKYFDVSADPGDSAFTDSELRDFIIGDYIGNVESELQTIDMVVTGNEWFYIGGNPAGFALGLHYREESLTAVYDSITQQDGWAFLIGNPNFKAESDVYSLFGEVLLPLHDNLELNIALRYEDYGSKVGSTTDPKLSLLWFVSPDVSLRSSIGTSFRAPSAFQTQGVQTRFVNITDFDGSTTFAGDRTVGGENLDPETSTAYNLGLSWKMSDNWDLNIDYWNFSFDDVLTKTNAQSIVTADPFDPRVERTSAGTISIVRTSFINANAIDTDGIDVSVKGRYETGTGLWLPGFDATYVLGYDLEDEAGNTIDGAERMNRGNFGDPMPQLRANLGLSWNLDRHGANVFLRYVSRYEDDVRNLDIDSFTTLDAQYSFQFGESLIEGTDTALTVGVINATNENPPLVRIAGNYDPKTGDPRGRRVYLKISTRF